MITFLVHTLFSHDFHTANSTLGEWYSQKKKTTGERRKCSRCRRRCEQRIIFMWKFMGLFFSLRRGEWRHLRKMSNLWMERKVSRKVRRGIIRALVEKNCEKQELIYSCDEIWWHFQWYPLDNFNWQTPLFPRQSSGGPKSELTCNFFDPTYDFAVQLSMVCWRDSAACCCWTLLWRNQGREIFLPPFAVFIVIKSIFFFR